MLIKTILNCIFQTAFHCNIEEHLTFAWETQRNLLPSPDSQKLELVHSFTIIFVLGDVIVFIIKLHYSSAICLCVCLVLPHVFAFFNASKFPCRQRQYFCAGVALDETRVFSRCILKPSRREDT